MGEGDFQPSIRESDREQARRKNARSDITSIFVVVAFVLFIIGFASASAPIPTAVVCWGLAGISMIVAMVLGAVNHFS